LRPFGFIYAALTPMLALMPNRQSARLVGIRKDAQLKVDSFVVTRALGFARAVSRKVVHRCRD
jgi:hypothetical protein